MNALYIEANHYECMVTTSYFKFALRRSRFLAHAMLYGLLELQPLHSDLRCLHHRNLFFKKIKL